MSQNFKKLGKHIPGLPHFRVCPPHFLERIVALGHIASKTCLLHKMCFKFNPILKYNLVLEYQVLAVEKIISQNKIFSKEENRVSLYISTVNRIFK